MDKLKKGQSIRGTDYDYADNESGIPTALFADYLNSVVDMPSQRILAARAGVTTRLLYRIFNVENPVTELGVVDQILCAIDQDIASLVNNGELIAVPFESEDDATVMAVYENLDDDDRLTASWRAVTDRAQELMDIREMVLSGDSEQVACALELSVI